MSLLLLFLGFVCYADACKGVQWLTLPNWIAFIVLLPLCLVGGLAEFVYLDYPYLVQPLTAIMESK